MHDSGRVNVHQMPEDRGLRWKCGGVFQYVFKRKFIILYELKRFAKRVSSLRISSNQNFSLGELPFTTATVLVCGSTRRILSKMS